MKRSLLVWVIACGVTAIVACQKGPPNVASVIQESTITLKSDSALLLQEGGRLFMVQVHVARKSFSYSVSQVGAGANPATNLTWTEIDKGEAKFREGKEWVGFREVSVGGHNVPISMHEPYKSIDFWMFEVAAFSRYALVKTNQLAGISSNAIPWKSLTAPTVK
jgi:hypothetical protein